MFKGQLRTVFTSKAIKSLLFQIPSPHQKSYLRLALTPEDYNNGNYELND